MKTICKHAEEYDTIPHMVLSHLQESPLHRGEEVLGETPHIMIAGASGRIGRRLSYLLGPTHQITALRHQKDIEERAGLKEVIEDFDVTNEESVNRVVLQARLNGARTFINCTGILSVDLSEKERGFSESQMYQVHVIGARNVARACKQNNLKLIHIGTEYEFDGKKPRGETYRETEKPQLDIRVSPTWYGQTKVEGGLAIFEEYATGSVLVRVSQVQGPTDGLFPITLKTLTKGEPFTRVNDQMISPITDITFATAINTIESALHGVHGYSPIYHVGATNAYTSYETCLMLADAYKLGEKARQLITPVTLEDVRNELLRTKGIEGPVRPKNSILGVDRLRRLDSTLLTNVEGEIARFHEYYPLTT